MFDPAIFDPAIFDESADGLTELDRLYRSMRPLQPRMRGPGRSVVRSR